MIYRTLAACVADLEQHGLLRRIDIPLDPALEIASIQRRALARNGPALLFTKVRGSVFPLLGNLFSTMSRTRFLFRSTLRTVEDLLRLKADPLEGLRRPRRYVRLPFSLLHAIPRRVLRAPVLECRASLHELPQLRSWPRDGGGYITLPQVYTEHPDKPGFFSSNLGMYRVQMSGAGFVPDREAGLHYQIHRGIGPHHAAALAKGEALRVAVSVGGPPALALAAMFPLPEDVPELCFAGLLAGHRIPMVQHGDHLPVPAEADFALLGEIRPGHTALEGPFGDHLGYYSLAHEFPVLTVQALHHRKNAVWPFTTVGRPPQEDTVFSAFAHELTRELIPGLFAGVRQVHAVDAAGVHPLLLALGSERYVPYAGERRPRELLTCGFALLGGTQTSLTKYLLIAAREDDPGLDARHVPEFFRHMLARTDFSRDLHFITRATMDTLDYTGISLNQGSKLLWAAAGPEKRRLADSPPALTLPPAFGQLHLFAPGILLCRGPAHTLSRDVPDPDMEELADALSGLRSRPEGIALLVVTDDVPFSAASWDNFLWIAFTRSDPATDLYGVCAATRAKHWGCAPPLVMDARLKSYQAPPLEPDPAVEKRVDALGAPGAPLYGLV
jgi:4-hydroxy-3-polyprenylbenzoate decarboxylase